MILETDIHLPFLQLVKMPLANIHVRQKTNMERAQKQPKYLVGNSIDKQTCNDYNPQIQFVMKHFVNAFLNFQDQRSLPTSSQTPKETKVTDSNWNGQQTAIRQLQPSKLNTKVALNLKYWKVYLSAAKVIKKNATILQDIIGSEIIYYFQLWEKRFGDPMRPLPIQSMQEKRSQGILEHT